MEAGPASLRRAPAALAAALIVVVASCGRPTGEDGPAVSTTATGGSTSSPPTSPATTPPTGGTTDGGSTAGGDAPGTGGTPPAGGTTTPDATTPSDPCSGLVPDPVGAPVEATLPSENMCGPSTSDPAGIVTLGNWTARGFQMSAYSPAGTAQGAPMTSLVQVSSDIDRWFHWTASGFHGIVEGTASFSPFELRTWDEAGRATTQSATGVVAITPDGKGGTVAIITDQPAPAVQSPPKHLAWIDAAGNVTRSVAIDGDAGAAIVNWTTGHVFLLVFGSSVRPTQGRWYDANGSALTAWFSFGVPKGSGSTWHLLVDGTVVLTGSTGLWLTATADGVEGPVAVPDWLRQRPNTRIATVRNGRGYAAVAADAPDRFEVVTTSGVSCGTVVLPSVGQPPNGASPRLDVGQDGTVLHTSGPAGNGTCTFRWWTGLLR